MISSDCRKRLQKELDALKASTDKAAKAHADLLAQASQQVEALRQHGSDLEVALATLRVEHAQLQKHATSDDGDRHALTRLRSVGANKVASRRRVR